MEITNVLDWHSLHFWWQPVRLRPAIFVEIAADGGMNALPMGLPPDRICE